MELVGTWKDDEALYLVEKEDDVPIDGAVKKIHKIPNHKSKEHVYYAYRNAGKLADKMKKTIDVVIDK